MKEYRQVLNFTYKNQEYVMYLDNDNKRFFLKVIDGQFAYLTDKEFAELTIFFASNPKIMKVVGKKKIKLIPSIVSGGITTILSFSVLTGCFKSSEIQVDNLFPSRATSEIVTDVEDFKNIMSLSDSHTLDSENDTYEYKDNTLYIYDKDFLDLVMEKENITYDMLCRQIDRNNCIPPEFKSVLYDYCLALTTKHPNVDLRVFYNNLKTLEVETCTSEEIEVKTGISGSYGCYDSSKNEIYVIKNYDYNNDLWAHQVIFHELTHCAIIGNYEIDGLKVKVQPEGPKFNNEITSEALTTLFTVSLFDYEENGLAYQLQSNYHKIMLDCLDDNYSLDDYFNHSLSYFENALNKYNGNDDAAVILELIQTQFKDYHSTLINASKEEYYPIIGYVCDMYYKSHISPYMEYDEMIDVAETLYSKVSRYVPNEYKIEKKQFYDHLDNYLQYVNKDRTR